ncbi:hypothetical protein M885DRAFT_617421 [Pelagophyceae sp. CCMP2097]|nr:hypothetical protein M885DRAFT_617421 [Pelagophyceae sp. CCMP2097]
MGCLFALALAAMAESLNMDALRALRLRGAQLSLEDAKWRRLVQQSTKSVKLEGDDVTAIAALRRVTRFAQELLDEEEFRAMRIVAAGGARVRPLDAPLDVRGPLGRAEAALVAALARPGGLVLHAAGAVNRTLQAVFDIAESETLRSSISNTNGARLRPLDAPPSALGNLEVLLEAVVREERGLALAYQKTQQWMRPSAATARTRGPLASLESMAEIAQRYERARFEVLREQGVVSRPMEYDPDGPLGRAELVAVGLYRAPVLLIALYERITQLLDEAHDADDADTRLLGPPDADTRLLGPPDQQTP